MYERMHVQHVGIHPICISVYQHICTSIRRKGKWKRSTTQRPTNLKRGRSERVSWGEAEEKSTVTVTLLQRRDNNNFREQHTSYSYWQTYVSVDNSWWKVVLYFQTWSILRWATLWGKLTVEQIQNSDAGCQWRVIGNTNLVLVVPCHRCSSLLARVCYRWLRRMRQTWR